MVIQLIDKFSRTRLAEKLEVSYVAVSNWERGVHVPQQIHQAAISRMWKKYVECEQSDTSDDEQRMNRH